MRACYDPECCLEGRHAEHAYRCVSFEEAEVAALRNVLHVARRLSPDHEPNPFIRRDALVRMGQVLREYDEVVNMKTVSGQMHYQTYGSESELPACGDARKLPNMSASSNRHDVTCHACKALLP